MDLSYIARRIRAHEGINLHDLFAQMPKLAGNPLLFAPPCLLIGGIGIAVFAPQPTACTGKDARSMRPQFRARQQIAAALAVIGHSNWNINSCPLEWAGQSLRDVAMEGYLLPVAIQENGDPAFAVSVEANCPHPRFNSLKKSLPLSSTMMKAGKSTTSMRQIASMPSSGYSTTSTFLMQCSARFAAAPPIEPR